MKCHICGKQRQWLVKVVRYPEDGTYHPSPFEWCFYCFYKELHAHAINNEDK